MRPMPPGANVQALMRPDGLPIWTSDALPGYLHDLTCAQQHDITGALYWAASQPHLPTPADSGYRGTGHTLQRSLRCIGGRGFALLTGRWRSLRRTTASPRSLGGTVRAALVLTHFEHRYLPNPC